MNSGVIAKSRYSLLLYAGLRQSIENHENTLVIYLYNNYTIVYYTLCSVHFICYQYSSMTTKQKIVHYLKNNWPQTAKQIIDHFGLYKTIIHRHLKDLIQQGSIIKLGKTPRVIYKFVQESLSSHDDIMLLWYQDSDRLDKKYFSFDSDGTVLQWAQWFALWCQERSLDIVQQYKQYRHIVETIDSQRNELWLLNTLATLQKKGWIIYLDQLFVADTYILGQFWKSPLWSLAFYGKQTQNRDLSKRVIENIKQRIEKLIVQEAIDAVCFVPVSIKRYVQLMTILQQNIGLTLPKIKLDKFFPWEVIAQKQLKGDIARNKNAENTIFALQGQKKYKKILLIDDFIGSWATLNISAKKLKQAWYAQEVIGFAIVGNMDLSYEVINEV